MIEMFKYLLSRFVIVLFIKFFYSWAMNFQTQCYYFFNWSSTSFSILDYILDWLWLFFMFAIILIGIFLMNLIYTIKNHVSRFGWQGYFRIVKQAGAERIINNFLGFFWRNVRKNYRIEVEKEKYPNLIILLVLFILPLIKGNPILNNYHGVYLEYSNPEGGGGFDKTTFIYPKNELQKINQQVENMEQDVDADSEVNTSGYIFLQAGLMEGFKPIKQSHKGFVAYWNSLGYLLLEKFIITIMYFLIPMLLFITGEMIWQWKEKRKVNLFY